MTTPRWLTEANMRPFLRPFLRQAYAVALSSPDPSTQNGALALDAHGVIIGTGSNDFTDGVNITPDLLDRPKKYAYIEHAERNAIYSCLRMSTGSPHVLVCPWAACADCARAIVQSGAKHLVRHARADDTGRWEGSINDGNAILAAGGVSVLAIEGSLGGCEPILFAGKAFVP